MMLIGLSANWLMLTVLSCLKNLYLMPLSSRQIAEAHYKLSMVLDLTSGRLGDAIVHAQKALESVEARLVELKAGLDGTMKPVEEDKTDGKGKGKASGSRLVRDGQVQNMSKAQIAAEAKELRELKEDLALKVRPQNVCFLRCRVHSFGVGRWRSSRRRQTSSMRRRQNS